MTRRAPCARASAAAAGAPARRADEPGRPDGARRPPAGRQDDGGGGARAPAAARRPVRPRSASPGRRAPRSEPSPADRGAAAGRVGSDPGVSRASTPPARPEASSGRRSPRRESSPRRRSGSGRPRRRRAPSTAPTLASDRWHAPFPVILTARGGRMARVLIVGCGCRGRALARDLRAAGHAVRGTTRDPAAHRGRSRPRAPSPTSAIPTAIATLMDALAGVTVRLLADGDGERRAGARGGAARRPPADAVGEARRHAGARRGARGGRAAAGRRPGARAATWRGRRTTTWRIPLELLEVDPADHGAGARRHAPR